MRPRRAASLAGLLGAGLVAYGSAIERVSYRLRRIEVPVLRHGQLRLLHVSDLHMTAGQTGKRDWVRELSRLCPDLVALTGDSLAAADAVPTVRRALGPLLAFPGVFVPGNNDYYAPVLKNPLRYIRADSDLHPRGTRLPWPELAEALVDAGWTDLTNRRTLLSVAGLVVAAAGVDDPHLRRDRYSTIAGRVDPAADLSLGLAHAPEPRVLDAFAADGYRLLLSGHTHGGQLRVPGVGALVTNCGLDRGRARGLSRHRGSWLHVSAGIGTSPYAPARFACPPEATLLTLVAASEAGVGTR